MIYIPIRRDDGEADALLDIEGVAHFLGITPSAVNQRHYSGSAKLPTPLAPEIAAALVFRGSAYDAGKLREALVVLLNRAGGRRPMRLWLSSEVQAYNAR